MSSRSGAVALAVRRLHPDAQLPRRMTADAAGLDLSAYCGQGRTLCIEPGARTLVPTGLVVAIPRGYEGQVRPRSGLALRHGVTVLNAPGTIDADYRGEVAVLLVNLGPEPFTIEHGDRIAQLVVAPVTAVEPIEADELPDAPGPRRGAGGFGSTGK